ncbi:putative NAD(P)/FAD-binding protein YdhS [Streptomyces sp. Ag109_G2-6]|uniref:FAD/NAD(P)-binding protein n=1 Tax=Streptomyces TaxID=1883 RepID=UPI0009A50FD1|nr:MULTISPECIES: FAD/NAD(P)-binding protein [Streptomyces]RPF43934.1 putative NAD(P)/FAD-binding protein YdhS [Streptomyces sp. Ag109_G2-6]
MSAMSLSTTPAAARPHTLAVVGTGPRGLAVLERLAVRLMDRAERAAAHGTRPRPVRIYAIDAVEVGSGRIWRTDQDDWFTMNTVISQVTLYSGRPDGGPARPGAGPSLGEWIEARALPGEEVPGPDDYAPRVVYGRYMQDVYRTIAEHLPPFAELVPVRARVTALTPGPDGGRLLTLDGAPHVLRADGVVLATGHPHNEPDAFERDMLAFADRHPGLRYLCGDSAADLDLGEEAIPPGTAVGIRGLGLSFYDVMLSLTVGRGGAFEPDGRGGLRYLPSGREPRIVAGSRSGLPIPARGRNEKPADHTHRPLFLTPAALAAARTRRAAATGDDRLDFNRDVLPLLLQEVHHVYWTARVRARSGAAAAARFAGRHAAALHAGRDPRPVLAEAGLAGLAPLDLNALARPFDGERFEGPEAFRERLLQVVEADLAEAALGNASGPLKAALDVLRDVRGVLRQAVDHGGLLPRSHAEDFHGRFLPVNSLLSAGPPASRVRQLAALVRRGIVEIAGPATEFAGDERSGRFTVSSPSVPGSAREVDVLVDARIPSPALHRDTAPLTRQLLAEGLIRAYETTGPDGLRYPTGGLDVTPDSFHVVDAVGDPLPGVLALGIPTEHTRWFTQVGSGRPGVDTLFHRDADTVARGLLDVPSPAPSAYPAASPAGPATAAAR